MKKLTKRLDAIDARHGFPVADTDDEDDATEREVVEAVERDRPPAERIVIHEGALPISFAELRMARRRGTPTNAAELAEVRRQARLALRARERRAERTQATLAERLDEIDARHGFIG